MFCAVVCALLAFIPAPARAGLWGEAPQTPHPAVVRVISPERNGASLGSGTLVDATDKHGLVLTCWHVVKDAAGNVIISFPDGFQSPGYVIKMDRDWDLAAVAIWRPRASPVPIAAQVPQPGEPLSIAGYGKGNYRAQSGRCMQYLSPGAGLPYDIVEMSAAARHGDSGGPIFNARGELAGVLFGEGDGATSGSASARVRMFLASIQPPPSATPPTAIAAAPPLLTPGAPPATAAAPQPTPSATPTDHLAAINYPTTSAPPLALPAGPTVNASPASDWRPAPAATIPTESRVISTPPIAPADAASAKPDVFGWEDLAGHTLGEQIKTGLAAIGVLLLLMHAARKLV
jgi:hypothetical protein